VSNDRALQLNPLHGTLPEKLEAFKVLATAISASGMMPGWDSPAKVMAGCWQADALGVHPAIYMQGTHPMEFTSRGVRKVAITPKWEFEAALLKARLPGFDYEVHEESEETCEITFKADGVSSQRVRYTMADAKRQGLYDRNDSYKTSPKEMLWKQVWHRGVDRIGAHVVMGLPSLLPPDDLDNDRPSSSIAEVVDEAVGGVETGSGPAPVERAGVPPPSTATVAEPATDYMVEFGAKVRKVFGLRANDRAGTLRRASVVMTEVLGGEVSYTRVDQIGQENARMGLEYLNQKYPGERTAAQEPAGAATEAARGMAAPAPAGDLDDGDPGFEAALDERESRAGDGPSAGPGPVGQNATPAPPPVAAPDNPDFNGTWEGVVNAVRKTGRGDKVLKEHPEKSGHWWLVAHELLSKMGHESALHVLSPDGPMQGPAEYERIARAIHEVYGVRTSPAPEPLPRHANRRAS